MSRRARLPDAGFTLLELLMVVAILGIISAIAIPFGLTMTEEMRLGASLREVEREMQTARLKAVTSNRTLQVRLNCPAAGQYRIVEVMNNANDNTANRCSETAYPWRAARDNDPNTPDFDGPVRYLTNQVRFTATNVVVFQFAPTGTTFQIVSGNRQAIAGTGVNLTLAKGSHTGSVNVNGLGRIRIN
jgi:prepilin-type N-terminal cleavage/methylation domain-containing protein